jgi:predicted transcriptional regulator
MPNYAERVLASQMSANKLDEQIEGGEVAAAARTPSEGRRSLLQIKVDILRAVESGYGKPTQIMYRANLSWNVLQVQLRSFLETGMLEVQTYGSRRRYLITSKGSEMVDSYQKVVKEILR